MCANKPGCKESCIKLYLQQLSIRKVANILKVRPKTVLWHITRAGISRKNNGNTKHQINHKCFDRWTDQSAYWFGFLLCDGSIPKGNRYRLQLALQARDDSHIKKFIKFIGYSKQPFYYKTKGGYKPGSTMCKIAVDNKYLIERLLALGWRNFKRGVPINIPNKFWWPFFRGLIDGDGTIFILNLKQGPRLCLGFCNKNIKIVEWVSNMIFQKGFTNPNPKAWRHSVPEIRWLGLHNVKSILDHTYSNAKDFLDRKRTIFIDYYYPHSMIQMPSTTLQVSS